MTTPTAASIHQLLAEKKRRIALGQSSFSTLYPDSGPLSREAYKKHIEFFEAGASFVERAFLAGNRCGKAQPIDELILTPTGFTELSNIRVGSRVIGSNGKTTKVKAVHPQGFRKIVRLTMSDGSSVRCDLEHLWKVRPVKDGRFAQYVVITAAEVMAMLASKQRLALPQRPPCEFDQREELPVDPYLLGLLLGDGGLSTSAVAITTADEQIRKYCADIAWQYGCTLRGGEKTITSRFSSNIKQGGRHVNVLSNLLEELGMKGKTAHGKRIPALYLSANMENRLQLLRGMMDTDGTCSKSNGARVYYSVSRELCEDLCFLAKSLGINAGIAKKNGLYRGVRHVSWLVLLPRDKTSVFTLKRKKDLEVQGKIATRPVMVESVEVIGEAECACIEVVAEDHLYITKDFLVTHNSHAGAYEAVCHLTGLYPSWWKGKRFRGPTTGWAAGDTSKTVKDIMQEKLLGTPSNPEAGMIPRSLIRSKRAKSGVPDAVASVFVEHVSGGTSVLEFKSFDQRRISFQGTARSFVWLDEEVDEGIYEECVMRTMKTGDFEGGIVYLTFTPLLGLTPVVRAFLPDGIKATPDRYVVFMGWEDAPHLDEKEKVERYRKMQPYLREARTKGTPQLGAGAIYPVDESSLLVQPFEIPKHWTRGYGMDVGWKCTAVIFAAHDRENQILYLTGEYKRGEATPSVHADVIKSRAKGWPGFIDPASRGRSQDEGRQLIVSYKQLGLDIIPANNAVDVGIDEIWDMMNAGRLKVFANMEQYKAELRLYRRDQKGRVVKEEDHLMDSKRYLNSRRDMMRVISPPSSVNQGNKFSGSLGFVR